MFSIDVEDGSGNRLGPGPITTCLSIKRRRALDQVGEASFRLPASDPRAGLLGLGMYYHIYRWDPIRQTRQDLGVWKRRSVRVVQDGDVALVEVACTGLEVELINELCYFNRNYSNVATNAIITELVGLVSGWSPGDVTNPGNLTIDFQGESIFQAIAAIARAWGYHFRQGLTARTLDFGAFGDDSGIRLIMPSAARVALEDNDAVALITGIEVLQETEQVVNKIVPLGAGLGETQLTIEGATDTDPNYPIRIGLNADNSNYYYISDEASISTYGLAAIPAVFSDVRPLSNSDVDIMNAKNALYRRALSVLLSRKAPLTVYKVDCIKLRNLQVGDRVRLIYRGTVTRNGEPWTFVDIDAMQYVLAIEESYQDGEEFRLELSASGNRPGDDGEVIAGIQHDLNIWKTHLQTYPCRSIDTRYEEMDSDHSVSIPIDIDAAVLYLNSCLIRLKTRPLRATAKSAVAGGGQAISSEAGGASMLTSAAGGASTLTSEAGGASTLTSAAGGGQTAAGGSHNHMVQVWQGVAEIEKLTLTPVDFGITMLYADWGGSAGEHCHLEVEISDNHEHNIAAHTHQVNIPAHNHQVNVPAHTHQVNIPAHNHTVQLPDHSHNLEYGIHDDSAYPDTVRIAVDGVDRTAALGGPWGVGGGAINVELDITNYLAGDLRREHVVTISCDAGQGTVESVVKLQMTVQGIAVS